MTMPKADKSMQIHGNYKVNVNRCVEEENYPLSNTEDAFATLAGGKQFTKRDISHVRKLEKYNVTVKQLECKFMTDKVE